jgi:lysophospholipid acyltransferase (LPLAT)-like uncharacterized protein
MLAHAKIVEVFMRFFKAITLRIKKSRVLSIAAKNVVYWLLWLLFRTYTLRINGDWNKENFLQQEGVFYFWHQHILSAMFFFFVQKVTMSCIVSPSNDGKFAGFICQKFGWNVLYGSAHKSPITLLRYALTELTAKGRLCLVGDGSRGPAFQLQPGITYLAEKTSKPIIYIECVPSRAFTFTKSWDQFKLPLPFSTITITIHTPT